MPDPVATLAAACDGHTETGDACNAICDQHKKEMRRHQERQRALIDLAYRLREAGDIEASDLLYAVGEDEWDDAIHIASPLDGHVSLCGLRGRNLAQLDGEWPDSGSGCWGCLGLAERLATKEAAARA